MANSTSAWPILVYTLLAMCVVLVSARRLQNFDPSSIIHFEDGESRPDRQADIRSSALTSHNCPNAKQRYHKESAVCFQPGRLGGPCGNNMIFKAEPDNTIYGDCECKQVSLGVPFVYHVDTDQCYATYDQAYCRKDQWLIFDQNEDPICESRKCPKHADPLVFFKGKCVKLFKPKPDLCSDPSSNSKQTVGFAKDAVLLSCIDNALADTSDQNIGGGRDLRCAPGSKRDIVGKCRVVKNVTKDSIGSATAAAPIFVSTTSKPTRRTRPTVVIVFNPEDPDY